MAEGRIARIGWLAVGIAVVGGFIALFNVVQDYQSSGPIDWGHLALAVGIPVFMYAIVKSSATRKA